MSIASELNNYRNGLDDAWDAAEDMGATIPHDRNMVNLDDAIRTIPVSSPNDGVLTITQNGVTIQTFSADQATNVTAALTDTTYSAMTGASSGAAGTSGLVPAPAAGDEGKFLQGDGTWGKPNAELVEMYYGESNAWAKFIDAYTRKCIVYCRASSNSNPGSGAKTRKAFMAYVNNEDNPTSVEFQYVRSVSSKTDSQQCDQVFVYTLTNASGGTWSVASRNMAPKINVDSTLTKTFSTGANATVTLKANAMTGATSGTAGTAGYVPAPAAGDQDKLLKGDGTWAAPTSATASDYLSFSSGFTVNTLDATKMGPFVKVHFDISGTISNGENVVGTATAKVRETSYGACRVTGGAQMGGASAVVIPSGAVRIYSSESGTGSAGDVWFFEA